MKAFGKLINFTVSLVMVMAVAYFAYMNTAVVYIYLPFLGEYNLPGTLAFMGAFGIGALFTCLYFLRDALRKSKKIRTLQKELRSLDGPSERNFKDDKPPVPTDLNGASGQSSLERSTATQPALIKT